MRIKFLFFMFSVSFATLTIFAQQTLNNDALVKMAKAGLSDEVIVSTINASAGSYDVTVDGLIALKQAGISDKVINTVVQKSSAPPASKLVSRVPDTQQSASGSDEGTGLSAQSKEGDTVEPGTVVANGPIPHGARIVIAPMGGFETYFAAAVREKKVPVTLTLDKKSAQYFVVSTNTEWQGFVFGSAGNSTLNAAGGSSTHAAAASTTRGLEASIMLINAQTKDVAWAYEVHKNSHGALLFGTLAARGQQSIAEACAKHLKEYIEKGK